ncbi:transcriptional regulator, HxlR family [Jatrophihabitans endophyticus]|uniref:Transcriptional regulator, HxlR family n=1 Tax=Jatrophihabitans endophyticus TaxID=1206085 RepID=A0A1M5ENJ3_9ACTN|nr:helix-turn-helix domain-containing protein [Jatrophihabitans endophyticus]SHF80863.1 transcriptional regulator, HxlR family [Jatrophihabitans endophyticus]
MAADPARDGPVHDSAVLAGGLADRTAWRTDACPVGAALGVVGTRSAMLIMREAYYGTARFDDFAERVGISEAVAAARLRELTDAGLLRRVPYREPGSRTRHEYRLTEMGRDLAPVVLGLFEWGSRYLSPGGRPPLDLTHADCGAAVHVGVECDAGHDVALGELVFSPARRRRRDP